MMGAGIAYVCALSGWEVVLKDVSLEAAEKGKTYSESLVAKACQARAHHPRDGRGPAERIAPPRLQRPRGLRRRHRAVFESIALKQEVFREAMKVIEPDALLCSNTSTLPISELGSGIDRPSDVVGLHFFSPVDKMPLIEITPGERTSTPRWPRRSTWRRG